MPPKILARNGGPDGDALVVAAEPVHVGADAVPPHILAQGKGSRAYEHWYALMWRACRKQQVIAAREALEQDPSSQARLASPSNFEAAKRKRDPAPAPSPIQSLRSLASPQSAALPISRHSITPHALSKAEE